MNKIIFLLIALLGCTSFALTKAKNPTCDDLEKSTAVIRKLDVKHQDEIPKASAEIKAALKVFDRMEDKDLKKSEEQKTIRCVVEFSLVAQPFDEGSVLSDALFSHYKKYQNSYDEALDSIGRGKLHESKEQLLKDFADYDQQAGEESKKK